MMILELLFDSRAKSVSLGCATLLLLVVGLLSSDCQAATSNRLPAAPTIYHNDIASRHQAAYSRLVQSNTIDTNSAPVALGAAQQQQQQQQQQPDTANKRPTKLRPNNDEIKYETKWFRQLVDHFGWANQDTWMQRYLVNTEHWCGANCPILFYCGNEGDIEVFTNNTGWMWENAKELHAMLVFAEHRYYGQSMPYKIDPTKVDPSELKSLGYLSSEQALADYAKLIYELRHQLYPAEHSPVITVGGSYGGMLAAWMRMKYPNAVQGALAGSAPILQFPDEYDCQQFNRIVSQDFENYSPNCSKSIYKSWSTLRQVASKPSGLAKIGQSFNTCKPLASIEQLLSLLNAIWVNMAMTDYANEATFLSKMPALPIKHACSHLNVNYLEISDEDLISAVSLASQIYTNYTQQLACLNIEQFLFDPMDVLWDFQSCTEMVMPICSNGVDDMFDPQPFDVSQFVADCKTRWGVETQVNKVKTLYGDKDNLLSSASRIIFSSCSRDPWSAGCPQESNESKQVYALKINGVCHHEDLRPSGPNDSAELKKARATELSIITNWIQSHYEEVRKFSQSSTVVWNKSEN